MGHLRSRRRGRPLAFARALGLGLAMAGMHAVAQTPPPAAPQDLDKLAAELTREAVQRLIGFAHVAEGNRILSRAREAYQLVLDRYDDGNVAARVALGFTRDKGVWVAPVANKQPAWTDAGDEKRRQRTNEAWNNLVKRLAGLHRVLGQRMVAQGEAERGKRMFELALAYDPADVEAHRGLGHGEFHGFYGTAEQLAFLARAAAIRDKAKELCAKTYAPETLDESRMPAEFKLTGWRMTGAMTAHFRIWTHDQQDRTDAIAAWAERSLEFTTFLLNGQNPYAGECEAKVQQFQWLGFMFGDDDRDLFFKKNPTVLGEETMTSIRSIGSHDFTSTSGYAEVHWIDRDAAPDCIVAQVAQTCFGGESNAGLGIGFVHAVTWLLLGTTRTWYGSPPQDEMTVELLNLRDPKVWLARLREQIRQGRDFPLQKLPAMLQQELRLRMKSWYFLVWLMARYPDRWASLLRAFPDRPKPEQCGGVFENVLGSKLDDLEAEWRDWAGGTSPIAVASGFGGK